MCGIGGIYSKTTEELLEIMIPMLEYLERRGPDGFGVGFINPYTTFLGRSRHITDYKKDKRDRDDEKHSFFKRADHIGHTFMASMVLLQTKYTTATNKQKKSKGILQRNMQPNHIYYDGMVDKYGNEYNIHPCLGIENGEIKDKPIRRSLKPRSKNKATVDSRFLTEIYYQKIREIKDEWKAAEWVMKNVEGGFSFGFSYGESLIFFKDRKGIRPLCLGRQDNNIILISENGFFKNMDIEYIREIKNGEMIKIDKKGNLESIILVEDESSPCGFCDYYFKDFKSTDFTGKYSCGNHLRFKSGELLGEYYKKELQDIDAIADSPKSGKSFAEGLAYSTHKAYKDLAWKIDDLRYFLMKAFHKYIFDTEAVEGLNIAVGDDSCVRGDTVQKYFYMIKKKGRVKKVKFFIGWPPIIHPCNLGIDTPTFKELFAYKLVEEGYLRVTVAGVDYKIEDINRIITDKIRNEMKNNPKYDLTEQEINDFEIYFGTPEMVDKVLPYNTCKQCFTGINPFTDKSNFFDENLNRKVILE